MAVKRGGLGRGLDTLIPDKIEKEKSVMPKDSAGSAVMVSIELVEPNREQPRSVFDEEALAELAESIRQYGVIQPLLVQKTDDYYEIIAGERRWRAAKLAGLTEIPVIEGEYDEQQKREIALIENLQRENLNPIEEARAYQNLADEFSLTQEEIAERVSKSRTAVTNSLRLLRLDERVQEMLSDGVIAAGHARALLALTDGQQQADAAEKVAEENLSVRETEKLIRRMRQPAAPKGNKKPAVSAGLSAVYGSLETQLQDVLGTKVRIHCQNAQKGKLEIDYYSQDDLGRIISLIRGAREETEEGTDQ